MTGVGCVCLWKQHKTETLLFHWYLGKGWGKEWQSPSLSCSCNQCTQICTNLHHYSRTSSHFVCCAVVMSNSLRPHVLQYARLLPSTVSRNLLKFMSIKPLKPAKVYNNHSRTWFFILLILYIDHLLPKNIIFWLLKIALEKYFSNKSFDSVWDRCHSEERIWGVAFVWWRLSCHGNGLLWNTGRSALETLHVATPYWVPVIIAWAELDFSWF